MKLEYRYLEAFCAVVEQGSITAAASALGLSQAALSERIARLEGEVGRPLLDRVGRRVYASVTGDWLYQRALVQVLARAPAGLQIVLTTHSSHVVDAAGAVAPVIASSRSPRVRIGTSIAEAAVR